MTTDDARLWHGGIAGLKVLDLILPPSITGNNRQAATREHLAGIASPGILEQVTPDDVSPDWVHFTPHRNYALAYAAAASFDFGAGALYVVEPIGDVETDPDQPVSSLRAHAAVVVTVYDPHVRITGRRMASLQAQIIAAERGGTPREQMRSLDRMCARNSGPVVMLGTDGQLHR